MTDNAMPNDYGEHDYPHSDAGHNPFWCGGDNNSRCVSDDPCWSCISWLHAYAVEVESKNKRSVVAHDIQ